MGTDDIKMGSEMATPDMYMEHIDPLNTLEDLIGHLYMRFLAYTNDKNSTNITDVRKINHEDTTAYFKKLGFVAPLFLHKGLEAFKMGDPGLAGRMFMDAAHCTPDPKNFIEPMFYMLLSGILFGWGKAEKKKYAQQILEHDPYIALRIDQLLARVDRLWWETIEAEIKALLTRPV